MGLPHTMLSVKQDMIYETVKHISACICEGHTILWEPGRSIVLHSPLAR